MSGRLGHAGLLMAPSGVAPGAPVAFSPAATDSTITLSAGNTVATRNPGTAAYGVATADKGLTVGAFTGLAVVQFTITEPSSGFYYLVGLIKSTESLTNYIGSGAGGFGYYQNTGEKVTAGVLSAYGASFFAGERITVGLHDDGRIEFWKSGISQGIAFTGVTGTLFPATSLWAVNQVATIYGSAADMASQPAGSTAWADV